ncbi:exopolyphosphatase [Pleionea sp. CnH1-48]|uniref:Ppx/GppA phosphatase family protein n=1 Tax=Pleionea sp. CnH1-48 TaxID=2954494 RepID=UPI002097264C|nr:exopolyphosphatase [Pleionea sp. CnH1-48]MCO7226545.1 exopolyphosphatase [Pleionea sp. CnH1-48]
MSIESGLNIAVLDLGSNSFHLTLAKVLNNDVKVLGKFKEKIRLAAGLDEQDNLTPDAQTRALECLKQFAQRLQGLDKQHVKAVATHTFRKAKNADDFIDEAEKVLGFPIEIISGHEEARLIFTGVSQYQDNPQKKLVVDIGGGSTEFAIGNPFEPTLLDSLQMGCVSFAKRYFTDGKITAAQFQQAETAAQLELLSIQDVYLREGWEVAFGCSGTIQSILSHIHERDANRAYITLDDLLTLKQRVLEFENLCDLSIEGIAELRQEILPSGLAVLLAIFRSMKIKRMEVAQVALREGLLFELTGRKNNYDIRERSINGLMSRFHIDLNQARRVNNTALALWQLTKEEWQLDDEYFHQMLSWAARCHEIGLTINFSRQQKHSEYLMIHTDIVGFTQRQQNILALLIRAFRRKFPLQRFAEIHDESLRLKMIRLARLLRLSVLFNHRRRDVELPDLNIHLQDEEMILEFPPGYLDQHPLLTADLELEQKFLSMVNLTFKY